MFTLSVTACASTSEGTISRYSDAAAVDVATRCGGGYQVFQRESEPRILVSAYVGSYIYKSVCERNSPVARSITGVDHEEAAIVYIEERLQLKGCRITGGTSLSSLHSEFYLSCTTALTQPANAQTR